MKGKNNTIKTLFQVFRKMKGTFFLLLIAVILLAVFAPLQIGAQKNLFDSLYELAASGESARFYFYLTLFIIANLGAILVQAGINPLFEYTSHKLNYIFNRQITEKVNQLTLENFEVKELYDSIEKATQGANNMNGVVMMSVAVLANGMNFVTAIGYLVFLHPMLSLVIVFAYAPRVLQAVMEQRIYQTLRDETINAERESDYYEKLFTAPEYMKDCRLLGCGSYFKKLWEQVLNFCINKQFMANQKAMRAGLLVDGIAFLGSMVSLGLSVYLLFCGAITIGGFAATLAASATLSGQLNNIIGIVNGLVKGSALANDYYEFVDENVVAACQTVTPKEEIRLKQVTFSYPFAAKPSLNGINLTIKANEKIALVGVNGSGKTTLAKMIAGLYTPTKGEVYHDQQLVTPAIYEKKYAGITAAFQNFTHYAMSIYENVVVSDVENCKDVALFENAIAFSEFPMEKHGNDKDALLGRGFGGLELSGGEWQKLAIARAYFRPHQVMIVDEPTAAIDPMMEKKFFEKLSALSVNKTVIFITHRLGAAQMADRILLMNQGEIVEEGTHEQLMAQKGQYAMMYQEQAQWYQR